MPESEKRAALGSDEERLFSKLKSDYSCGVCISVLQDAVTTPCGHLFCYGCLKAWELSVFPEIVCPKCRKRFKMEDTIRMYNGSSSATLKRARLSKRQLSGLAPELAFQCQKMGNIMLYETDFSDAFSFKSIILLVFATYFTFALIFCVLSA